MFQTNKQYSVIPGTIFVYTIQICLQKEEEEWNLFFFE